MISHPHKAVFIHIPKTGGTSIESALGHNRTEHRTATYLMKRHGTIWNDYFTFSVIRNPWDRMVSIYFYYKLNNEPANVGIKKDMSPTFLHFIHEFKNKKRKWFQPFYVPQSDWLCDGEKLLIDHVCRFENFNEDVSAVLKKIGVKRNLPHKRKSKHDNYKTYYDVETIEIVRDIFEKDIKLFNYDFE
jgi:hypothetical protein